LNWLTITEVSHRLQVSDRTIRRYCQDHKLFIDTRKEPSRPLEVNDKSLDTIKEIRAMYEQGWDRERVERRLNETKTKTIQINDAEKFELPATVGETLNEFKAIMLEMAKRQKAMEEYQDELLDTIHSLKKQIRDMEDKNNSDLTQIQATLSRLETYKEQSIWEKWFGKKRPSE
jgi:DNA-binding transcriptional MerR regulator